MVHTLATTIGFVYVVIPLCGLLIHLISSVSQTPVAVRRKRSLRWLLATRADMGNGRINNLARKWQVNAGLGYQRALPHIDCNHGGSAGAGTELF